MGSLDQAKPLFEEVFTVDREQVLHGDVDVPAGEDGPVATNTDNDELARAQAQAAEYLDLLTRERAGFINFRRRAEQEQRELQQYAGMKLIKRLLPIVDAFERAVDAAPDQKKN